jgi:hypothetical protein
MKLRTTGLAVALVTATFPSLATSADAGPRGWRGGYYAYRGDPVFHPAYTYEFASSYDLRLYRRTFAASYWPIGRPAVVVGRRHWVRY